MSTVAFLVTAGLCAIAMKFLQQWHTGRRQRGAALRPALLATALLSVALLLAGADMGWQKAPFMWLAILSMVALLWVVIFNLRGRFTPKA